MFVISNLLIGPIIISVILGFVLGSRIHLDEKNSFKFTASGIIALIIGALIVSFGIGQFPYYNDLPIATTFLGALFGLLIGSALLGGRAKGDH